GGRSGDRDAGNALHDALQPLDKDDRLVNGLEHLPVAGDERDSHVTLGRIPAYPALSVSAATPGSVRPPRNSSEAPPPVEMCVIRSAIPDCFTAAIESPPPTIVVPLTPATARATALVPIANAAISKTPIGPFHTTVFASAIAFSYISIVAGPISTPNRSPIRESVTSSTSFAVPGSIRSVTTWSTGRSRATPRFAASTSIALAASSLSSSTSERPTGRPRDLRNV